METKITFKQSIQAGLWAAVTAVVINVILFIIFHAAGVITDNIFIAPNMPLTVIPVIFSSVIPTLLASMVFFLFEKFSKQGFKIFTIISLVLLVLSFLNPFLKIPNVTIAYAIVLNVMHVVVVLALFYFIKKAKKS